MTKEEMVNIMLTASRMDNKAGMTRAFNALFDSIKESVANGDRVTISGFGSFMVNDTNERQGRNPQTGEVITIPASKRIKFKASNTFKNAVK